MENGRNEQCAAGFGSVSGLDLQLRSRLYVPDLLCGDSKKRSIASTVSTYDTRPVHPRDILSHLCLLHVMGCTRGRNVRTRYEGFQGRKTVLSSTLVKLRYDQ